MNMIICFADQSPYSIYFLYSDRTLAFHLSAANPRLRFQNSPFVNPIFDISVPSDDTSNLENFASSIFYLFPTLSFSLPPKINLLQLS